MKIHRFLLSVTLLLTFIGIKAENTVDYKIEALGTVCDGDFAPHYMTSNVHGILTQSKSALLKFDVEKVLDESQTFGLGYGATAVGGYSSAVGYSVYDKLTETMNIHNERPAPFWLHQFYLDVKYRSVFITLGAKEQGSKMLNDRLSSGDMTMSANSRPMPGIKAGFIKPQNIPFTNGWVQISGELGYYKQTDNDWLENHYNYYSNNITTDVWFNYKYCYFNTREDKPFSVKLGMQASCQFGGKYHLYLNGEEIKYVDMSPDLGTIFRTFVPGPGGDSEGDRAYVEGNHVGSWDLMGRYRFKDGTVIKAYYQSPWEDGSGIGMMNGFDGLYGVEYKSPNDKGIITGAVVEYMDLMNQGGPLHFAPGDFPGITITEEATGGDNYYNNYAYNGYQYYGMSLGSPVLKSPIFNRDGHMAFTDTRLRSFHVAVEGSLIENLSYRAMFSFTKSLGTIFLPHSKKRCSTSALMECSYRLHGEPDLQIKGQLAFDRGTLYGDNFGALVSISYRGLLKF